jgi:TrmH family RNA methyltransferase
MATSATITSPQNERVKLVRALHSQPKARRKADRVALEGVRLIADAVAAALPDFVLYTRPQGEAGRTLLVHLEALAVPCLEVTPDLMRSMCETDTPQGMVAVLPMPRLPAPPVPHLVLFLDGVSDPGNLGTILRASAAAGADEVVLLPGCVDPFNPKALRSGMGAHFRVPLAIKTWAQVADDYADLPLYVADAQGDQPYFAVDWTRPAGLVIGGEARGAAPDAYAIARSAISIPMENASESLNAAVAAAVILFECQRQRLLARPPR